MLLSWTKFLNVPWLLFVMSLLLLLCHGSCRASPVSPFSDWGVFVLCMCGWILLPVNALGPIPEGVTVSPNGCQSLRVTWTPLTLTPPLTVIQYRVRYQAQGGSNQDTFTPSGSLHTITGLTPDTMYTVTVWVQTELGYGGFCCTPMASTNNGKAPSDARGHMPTPCSYGTVTATQHTICTANSAPLAVHGPHWCMQWQNTSTCSETIKVPIPLLQWVPHAWSHCSRWSPKEQSVSTGLLQLTCVDWPIHSISFSMGWPLPLPPHTPACPPPHHWASQVWQWGRSTL